MKTKEAITESAGKNCCAASIGIGFKYTDDKTPTWPEAKRGAVHAGPITETSEQLKAGLIWWTCLFCNKEVLIQSYVRGREKCKCGAVRCHSKGGEGWTRNGETWWFI